MMVRRSFGKKLEMSASAQLGRELAEFSQLCACAGLRNSPAQVRKARINHYGVPSRKIPARQYVWAATHNHPASGYGNAIKDIILRGIHDNPTPHTQVTEAVYEWGLVRTGSKVVAGTAKHGTPVFAGRNGYEGLLAKIAKQMEINQYNAISELNIDGKTENAKSTIRKKGFDHPLEWTGAMENAITSWVAKQ